MSDGAELPAAEGPSLTARAAGGVAWMGLIALAGKVVGLIAQLALGHWLFDDDFGAYAAAVGVCSFFTIAQTAGLQDVLVQRRDELARWVNPAFWLGMVSTGGAVVVMLALAWPTAWFYDSPTALGLITVLAVRAICDGFMVVPMALLQAHMRFRALAAVGFVNAVLVVALAVPLAAWGFGAYAMAIPALVVGVPQSIVLWRITRPKVRRTMQMEEWGNLGRDGWRLVGMNLINNLTAQGDRLILGAIAGKGPMGVYFFAYNLSVKTVQLFAETLNQTLFPVLSAIQGDSSRQLAAFNRACRALLMVGAPLCILQAATGRQVIRLIYGSKWDSAVPIFEVLSATMPFLLLASPQVSLMKAQRRMRRLVLWSLIYAPSFLGVVALGAWLGGGTGAAVAVGTYFVVLGPLGTWVATSGSGGTFVQVLGLYWPATVAAVLAAAPGVLLARWAGSSFATTTTQVSATLSVTKTWPSWVQPVVEIGVTGLVMVAIYVPLAWAMDRATFKELWQHFGSAAVKIKGKFGGGGSPKS